MEESKIFRFRSLRHDIEEIQDHLSACMLISRDHGLYSLRKHVERAFLESIFTAIGEKKQAGEALQDIDSEMGDRYCEMLNSMETEFLVRDDTYVAHLLTIARKAIEDRYAGLADSGAKIVDMDVHRQ